MADKSTRDHYEEGQKDGAAGGPYHEPHGAGARFLSALNEDKVNGMIADDTAYGKGFHNGYRNQPEKK